MSLTTGIAIYFIIWWLALFVVLPWGIRSQQESGDISPGTDPGAPALPRLMAKLAWTTVVAAVIFAALYLIYVKKWVLLEDLATLWGLLS
jgi:predicted secreted protein